MQNVTAIYPCTDCVGELKFTCFQVSELIIVLTYVVLEFNKGDSTLLSVCSQAYIQLLKKIYLMRSPSCTVYRFLNSGFHAWDDGYRPQPWTE